MLRSVVTGHLGLVSDPTERFHRLDFTQSHPATHEALFTITQSCILKYGKGIRGTFFTFSKVFKF